MKTIKILLSAVMMLGATAAMAQQDFSDPKWAKYGATPEERERNILNTNFLKESCDNKDYNAAAYYFNELVKSVPALQESIYQRGALIYKNKINRAKTVAERDMFVDSLMIVYDLRAEHFGNHPTRGKAYILDQKAREMLKYKKSDRAGIRAAFRAAIEAGGENTEPEAILVYFTNLCDDYKNTDEVMPEEILSEYNRLVSYFDKHADAAELKKQFDAAFALSGAADCENLEQLYAAKLSNNPDDEALLTQAMAMMGSAKCESDFYLTTGEHLYTIAPSSNLALQLAEAFQSRTRYDKAIKYLNEALAVEEDATLKQQLLIRVGLVGLQSNNFSSAAAAARQARELNPEDGVACFILAQCYGSTANCGGIDGQGAFWAAYDVMAKAVELLPADSPYLAPAKASLGAYRSHFPSSEECFFNELKAGARYVVKCGLASGVATTVRPR